MAVLVDKKTKVLVQGITGTQASFHIQRAIKYGTKIVAGVVPNKTEKSHLGIPLFNTVKEAKEKTGATASIIFVPAKFAKQAVLEAIDAEMDVVVVITSGIPVGDMMEIFENEFEHIKIFPDVASFPSQQHLANSAIRFGNIGINHSTALHDNIMVLTQQQVR